MKIKSAEFIKGLRGEDDILEDGLPQVAFIGRSNVGKSSDINSIVNRRDLARSSAKPGKTVEINFYKLNKEFYLVDLPGYGYAKTSLEERENLRKLIYWYLLYAHVDQKKIVLIIDAKVGATALDLEILRRLSEAEKNIVIIANKYDKLKNSEQKRQMNAIQAQVGKYPVIPYSALEKTGLGELINTIFGSMDDSQKKT
jgi:GTP-binding protein